MGEMVSFTTIMTEVGPEGILLSLGKTAVQLAIIVGCVVLIRRILKKMGKTKGTGLKVGWSVDEAEAREEYGVDETPKDKEEE